MSSLIPLKNTQRAFNGARALAYNKPKPGIFRKVSTISIKSSMWAEMLTLCNDDTKSVFAGIKHASQSANPIGHKTWSDAVRTTALQQMRGNYKRVIQSWDLALPETQPLRIVGENDDGSYIWSTDEALAADNNKAWEQMKSQAELVELVRPKMLFLTHPLGNRAARGAAKKGAPQ